MLTDVNQSNDNHEHSNHQHVITNGKQYWIPKVPNEVKPKLKGHYKSYEDITDMYYKYALAASFDVRKTTNRKNVHDIIRLQVLPNTCHVDTLNPNKSKIQRRTDSRRTGCNARIRFSMIKGSSKWLLYEFVEEHNHELISQDNINSTLSKEDIESYTWLLKSFLKAFGKQPILVLSNDEPTMKNSIAKVFPELIHRLCMWHITSKLRLKEFKLQLKSLIWNSKLEEKDFEQGWQALLDEHDLTDSTWLRRLYNLRHLWIPAFFKRVRMSGLMRTSRSECQTSAFHQNTHYGSTLKQCYTQSSLDFKTKDKFPKMRTPFPIEENASLFYKHKVFRQVQNKMYMLVTTCFSLNDNIVEHVHEFLIKEFRPHGSSTSNRPESLKLTRKKTHSFVVDIIPLELLRKRFRYSDFDEHIQKVAINIFSMVDNCLTNKKSLEDYYDAIKKSETKVLDGVTIHERPNKSMDFGNRLGVSIPTDVQIQTPTRIRNKGYGTKKKD
uniref:Protein FAR1-RELATED SEQUENCE n=1 Tax=Lactuca sativa TaxID=4236 RepID=A0A9R1VIT2_LACSA|nr:hypothetical protein LSAT_V11C500278740 [Lactuca sativa]